jgi:hypothetical protein
MKTRKRRSHDGPEKPPIRAPVEESTSKRQDSPTAVAAETLRTGVLPQAAAARRPMKEIPSEDETIRVGDPDDGSLSNEYVGEETPGGSNPTPDQSNVDDIGRAYGLQEEDTGALRSAWEVLERRDRHRDELHPPGKRTT